MFKFALHNFRSFRDPGLAEIRPLTIIVGENSTGKSSFLAILRIALEMAQGNIQPNFNRDPFFLGAYDQIAHYRGGRGGRSPSFGFALTTTVTDPRRHNLPSPYEAAYNAEFAKSVSQPELQKVKMSCGNSEMNIEKFDKKFSKIFLSLPSWSGELPNNFYDIFTPLSSELGTSAFLILVNQLIRREELSRGRQMPEISEGELRMFAEMWLLASHEFGPPPLAIAPVRTKPERTYNPIEDRRTPEGSHIPMVLARMYFTDRERWGNVQSALNRFGKSSGLFDEVSLKILGRSPSDPFQIMVKTSGPRSNLIDVGYGVSQILPIVIDLLSSDKPRNYLLQQPEVHLHPRGQAELATFLATIVKETNNWIVMETHSDYIIDRLRSDIRKKRHLSSDMISILFLEKVGVETKIHHLSIDDNGNLQDVPDTYRQFTMDEERKLLGIEDEQFA